MSAYRDRIAADHCGRCNEPNTNGRSLCDTCREGERHRAAAKRKRNAAAGTCLNCGKPVGTRSNTKCDRCLDVGFASQGRARKRRKAAGICQSCGQKPPMPDKTVCAACSVRMTDVRMEHYRRHKAAGLCAICGAKPAEGYSRCQKCRNIDAAVKACYRRAALDAYGGPTCVGCGCVDEEILEIDHIDGGGNEHRREIGRGNLGNGSGSNFYRWLKKHDYPAGLRILCPTCNKKAYKGIALPSETE